MSARNKTFDIAKGILILLVVLGHSGSPLAKYIYWFHMPAFFLISGIFAKQITTWKQGRVYLAQKFVQYATLYTSYFLLVFLISLLYIDLSKISFSRVTLKFIIGGRFVGAELGAFWFLSCLFFSIVIFTLIQIFVHGPPKRFAIIGALYIIAHVESFVQSHLGKILYVPWSVDISILAVCYLAIGFYMRDGLLNIIAGKRRNLILLLVTLTINGLIIGSDFAKMTDFRLNMKDVQYSSIAGDLLIPITFFLNIIALSALLDDLGLANVFCWFGYYSVVIMLLHMSILGIYTNLFEYNWGIFFFLGSLLPLFAAFLCDRNRFTRALFIRGHCEKMTTHQ